MKKLMEVFTGCIEEEEVVRERWEKDIFGRRQFKTHESEEEGEVAGMKGERSAD